jgi:hypothetical protein
VVEPVTSTVTVEVVPERLRVSKVKLCGLAEESMV